MAMAASNQKEEESTGAVSPAAALFQDLDGDGASSLAEGFRDKVSSLHSHFDRDGDGHLNHSELRGLQLLTSGSDMDKGQYIMVCKSLGCDPHKGVSVDALKLVYASEGTNIDEDYAKVCGKNETDKANAEDEDGVLEVGENGVDISS